MPSWGRLTQNLIEQAEKADARDPDYPSNLSAALFEVGDYLGCVGAVLRAWRRLKDLSDKPEGLVLRLSVRLAKAHCHGARAGTISMDHLMFSEIDIDEMRSAATRAFVDDGSHETLLRAWPEWSVTRSELGGDYRQKREACLVGFSRLPIFCKPL